MFKLEEEEKYVLMYALFKLELVRGKTIIFVSTVDRCYKVTKKKGEENRENTGKGKIREYFIDIENLLGKSKKEENLY